MSSEPSRRSSEWRTRLVDSWPLVLAGAVLFAGMVAGEVLLGDRLLIESPAASAAVLAASGVVGICFGTVSGGRFRTQSSFIAGYASRDH